MSDEVSLDGKKYISSKRAAILSSYTQDYIGQLARSGQIDAKRVGGLWYVQFESLEDHKLHSEEHKHAPSVKKNEHGIEAATVVSFDGRQYVSASRAAEVSGYTQDYVGQLSRAGKILSRQVGNRWYVDLEALTNHKKEKDKLLAALQSQSVGIKDNRKVSEVGTEKLINEPFFKYIPENRKLAPMHLEDHVNHHENNNVAQYTTTSNEGYTSEVDANGSYQREYGEMSDVEDSSRKGSRKFKIIATVIAIVGTSALIGIIGIVLLAGNRIDVIRGTEASAIESKDSTIIELKEVVSFVRSALARKVDYSRAQ